MSGLLARPADEALPTSQLLMQAFFNSGHAADVVLAVLALEGLWLNRKGWSWARLAAVLGPAVFIVLAVRAALVGAAWYWVALALLASLPLHLWDVRQRLAEKKARENR